MYQLLADASQVVDIFMSPQPFVSRRTIGNSSHSGGNLLEKKLGEDEELSKCKPVSKIDPTAQCVTWITWIFFFCNFVIRVCRQILFLYTEDL